MAKKFGMFDDIGEQLLELGKSTAKQSVKAVTSIVDPTKLIDSDNSKNPQDQTIEQLEKGKTKKNSSTPLNLHKLQNKYEDQDKAKTQALRQKLFQMVKAADEKLMMENRQEELQKKREEAYQEQEKKKRTELEKQQAELSSEPQGKVRRSIFSAKKVAKREQAEVKPASGKQ